MRSDEEWFTLPWFPDLVTSIAYCSDGRRLATGCYSPTQWASEIVREHRVVSGALLELVQRHITREFTAEEHESYGLEATE